MATHPGPRPKRKEYASKLFYDIALSTWETMSGLYRMDREREREEQQAQRQREREERKTQARKSRRQQAGKVAGAVIGTAISAYTATGVVGGTSLASSAFPGQELDAAGAMMDIADVRAGEEKARRGQDMDEVTRQKGYSRGYDSLY